MRGRVRLEIRSVSPERAIDKLKRAGIPVFFVRKSAKNVISLEVESKDRKKVFAILRSPCYNVRELRARGLALAWQKCTAFAGLLFGIAVFCGIVPVMQARVLKIEIVGSGAYYRADVLQILSDGGIGLLAPLPENTAACSAEILSLPRVSYCALHLSGGILTVEVEVSDDNAVSAGESLLAPETGVITELVAVRGTALKAVGDEVKKGDAVVLNRSDSGPVLVIARVKVRYAVEAFYEGTREEAQRRAAFDYGGAAELSFEEKEGGFRVTGAAYREASCNLE